MKIRLKELYFISTSFFVIGIIFWQPAYLDFDSRFNWQLQSQVLLNYVLLSILIIPFYIYSFKSKYITDTWKTVRVYLACCPIYIFLWVLLGRKIYAALGGTYVYGNRLKNDFYRNDIYCDIYLPFLIYVLFFISAHIYHYYLQKKKIRENERAIIQKVTMNEISLLKSNIQPSFLSNSLNIIGSSIPLEYKHTRSLIYQLTQLISFSLKVSGKEKIPLSDEIEFIKNYLTLEQERFDPKVNVVYEITEESLQFMIPPMLIQPLIENAVKHGIEKNMNESTIRLRIYLNGGYIHILISDTGKGIPKINHSQLFRKGTGLGNTRQRLLQLFNENIQLEENLPSGLRVFYKIPYDSRF
ncbi:Histidine kinase-, DNA gyrase B-, and HSP90-like ATPase [Pedobacter terrae]|uniref:Histidine kinase-, DNA gyrase B-, and HSP90-like ATPase n=1 Tax=Pedobacter terrae TaxID=405671 RepID=A0A1G8EET5_9SPHI|nr:histidine kinase [Pedobacter terrae]SDH68413.1 Histidine kinase-, DNA gyrase B-, and HSP90-like ATPase [Pedobacter terrae]